MQIGGTLICNTADMWMWPLVSAHLDGDKQRILETVDEVLYVFMSDRSKCNEYNCKYMFWYWERQYFVPYTLI